MSSIWEREDEQTRPAQPDRAAAQPGSAAAGGSAALNGTAEKHEEVDEPRRQRLRQVGPHLRALLRLAARRAGDAGCSLASAVALQAADMVMGRQLLRCRCTSAGPRHVQPV